MIMQQATPQLAAEWRAVWNENKQRLRANRKSGAEVEAYLKSKYPLRELHDEKALRVVTSNVLGNRPYREKLPVG